MLVDALTNLEICKQAYETEAALTCYMQTHDMSEKDE